MRDLGRYCAATVSLLLHGGLLAALMLRLDQAPATAAHAGVGGIEVSFGPAGSAPGTLAASPRPEPVEPPPEPESGPAVVPLAQQPSEAIPLPPAETPAPIVLPPPNVKPQPRPFEKIATAPPPERTTAVEPSPEHVYRDRDALAGAAGRFETGSGESRSGGGTPGAVADYISRLRAWLERHKQYPREARAQHQEGTALLFFSIDREGRVLSYRLHRSSGYGSIDREVLALIQRADPLPAVPAEMARPVLEIVVPIKFELR